MDQQIGPCPSSASGKLITVMALPEAREQNPSVGGGYGVRQDASPEHGHGEQK